MAREADPRLGGLGLTFKDSWRRSFSGKTHPKLLALGFTHEFKEQLLEEFDALEWQFDVPLYCVWARRSSCIKLKSCVKTMYDKYYSDESIET